MLFTYTTIFFASLLVALAVLLIYKLVSKSSQKIHDSRVGNAELNQNLIYHKAKATRGVAYSTSPPADWNGRGAPLDLTEVHPARTTVERGQSDVWPYRKTKLGSVGSSHKVKRGGSSKNQKPGDTSQPWGW